jgi:SAM-dependent methyltransferase
MAMPSALWPEMTSDPDATVRARQRQHWAATFAANPHMYGSGSSESAAAAAGEFASAGVQRVLELGAGQGRDTLALARRGFDVLALDFVEPALASIAKEAAAAGLADRLNVAQHDVRVPLPFPDDSFDASYSHMLFCMALTTGDLERLVGEVRRVIRPGGLVVYTVRHTGDAHYGTGLPRGDDMFEHGGFIVHFFDRDLVERLADGFELVEVVECTEGDLPRRLWRVRMRKPVSGQRNEPRELIEQLTIQTGQRALS